MARAPSTPENDLDATAETVAARPAWWRRWLPLAVIVAVAAGVWLSGAHRVLSLDVFIEKRADLAAAVEARPVVAFLSVGLAYVVAVALSIPGALILTLMSGFLFGAVFGGLLAVVAATAGATVLFLAARSSLGSGLRRRAGPGLARFADGFREDAFNYLLFLRLVPVAPFWLVNLAPALLGVGLRTFVLSTMIGIVPGTFTFATVGAGLDSAIAAQEAANAACLGDPSCVAAFDVRALVTPQILAAFALLGVLALVPVAVKRWRRARGGPA